MPTFTLLLFLTALILFILSAVGVSGGRINLQSAGLACLTAAFLIGQGVL